MKRIERKHLKEDGLAHTLRVAREYVEPREAMLRKVGIAALVLVIVGVGYGLWSEWSSSRGQEELAEALVALNAEVVPAGVEGAEGIPAAALAPTGTFATEAAKLDVAIPKLKAAADAYPGSDAGIQARYRLAGALASLGRHDEAIAAFDEVIRRAANSLYGRTSLLGRAEAQAQAGQLDTAIDTLKNLAARNDEDLPADAILMHLAKAYAQQGNRDEARKTFTEIVDKHPDSPYITDARVELENLEG